MLPAGFLFVIRHSAFVISSEIAFLIPQRLSFLKHVLHPLLRLGLAAE